VDARLVWLVWSRVVLLLLTPWIYDVGHHSLWPASNRKEAFVQKAAAKGSKMKHGDELTWEKIYNTVCLIFIKNKSNEKMFVPVVEKLKLWYWQWWKCFIVLTHSTHKTNCDTCWSHPWYHTWMGEIHNAVFLLAVLLLVFCSIKSLMKSDLCKMGFLTLNEQN